MKVKKEWGGLRKKKDEKEGEREILVLSWSMSIAPACLEIKKIGWRKKVVLLL